MPGSGQELKGWKKLVTSKTCHASCISRGGRMYWKTYILAWNPILARLVAVSGRYSLIYRGAAKK